MATTDLLLWKTQEEVKTIKKSLIVKANIYDFDERASLGRNGVKCFTMLLEAKGWLVIDVSEHPGFRKHGIDVLAIKGNKLITCEVKTDEQTTQTGNMVFEMFSIAESWTLGWGLTSKAEWLVYYVPPQHKFIFVRMEDMRQLVRAHWGALQTYSTSSSRNTSVWTTLGVLVPIQLVKKAPSYSVTKLNVSVPTLN
ncbi:MAG: hypothetical protein ACTSUS_07890 [Candidatus Freyarchaeota archaeon]